MVGVARTGADGPPLFGAKTDPIWAISLIRFRPQASIKIPPIPIQPGVAPDPIVAPGRTLYNVVSDTISTPRVIRNGKGATATRMRPPTAMVAVNYLGCTARWSKSGASKNFVICVMRKDDYLI